MFDSTLHAKTLARQIRQSDFHSNLWQFSKADQAVVVGQAVEIATSGFTGVSLRRNQLGGKPVYQHSALSEALLTRHVSESVRRITKVRQSDRQSIIKSLMALAAEGVAFKIFKIDIKSFYESVDTAAIVKSLKGDAIFSRQSIYVLQSFFDNCEQQGIVGLPRGLSLSATLAEYTMRKLDTTISSYPGVTFYNRFVDDAIIVTLDHVDLGQLRDMIEANLPNGLSLNRNKTNGYNFNGYSKNNAVPCEHKIDFLGYELSIGPIIKPDKRFIRHVVADISPKKVSKIKRRLSKAIIRFNNDNSFDDLLLRFKILTSNYGFVDRGSGQQRFSGLRYNYNMIDAQSSLALASLDKFLVNVLTSKSQKNRLRPTLTKQQVDALLGLKFSTGYLGNRFFSFSYDQLQHALRCWSHA